MSEQEHDVIVMEGAFLPDIAAAIKGFQKHGWTVIASPVYQTKNINVDNVELIEDGSSMQRNESLKGSIRHRYDCIIYLRRAPTYGAAQNPVQSTLKIPGGLR